MRPGETDPELRRVYGVIYLDDGVTLATDADVSPPVGSLQVTVGGASPVAAGGNFVGDGAGEYYYEFTAGELVSGMVGFKFERSGYKTEWLLGEAGDLFTVGETDPAMLRLPIVIFNDSSPPALASATVTAPSQLQTALSGVTFADAVGTLHFVGVGLHYYQAAAADASAEGSLLVKFEKVGYQTQVAWTPISPPLTGAPDPATLIAISPLPSTPPGDPGGFSSSPSVASVTPVQIAIAGAVPNLDRILVTFTVDGVEEIAYYAGLPRGRYVSLSHQSVVGDQLTVSLLRVGGWSKLVSPMTLTVEGVSPSVFSMVLPTQSSLEIIETTSTVAVGALDIAEQMMDRLPRQFRNKPKIEKLVRALAEPIQLFENTAVDVLSHLGIDDAFGAILRGLAARVGQSVEDLDDDTLRRFVRARVAANKSSGTVNDLITVADLILNSPTVDVAIQDRRVATSLVTVLGDATSVETAAILLKFLRVAKSSSVRLKIVFFITLPLFRFDSGPGFDQGHFMTSLETSR